MSHPLSRYLPPNFTSKVDALLANLKVSFGSKLTMVRATLNKALTINQYKIKAGYCAAIAVGSSCVSAFLVFTLFTTSNSEPQPIQEVQTIAKRPEKVAKLKSYEKALKKTAEPTLAELQNKLQQMSANLELLSQTKNQFADLATPKNMQAGNGPSVDSYDNAYAKVVDKAPISAPSFNSSGNPINDLSKTISVASFMNERIVSMKSSWAQDLDLLKKYPTGVPVPNGVGLTSNYGPRVDPFTKKVGIHNGIDFAAREGTPVLATGDGVVTKSQIDTVNGKFIEIEHVSGYKSMYGHLSKQLVQAGDKVNRGQNIGEVGTTGRSTNPHLHYELTFKGVPINPIDALMQNALPSPQIAGQQLQMRNSNSGYEDFNLANLNGGNTPAAPLINDVTTKTKVINISQ